MASGHIFATVGTTKFDLFISTLSCEKVLHVLRERGYTKLTMQIGHGTIVPPSGLICDVQVEYFRFKDSVTEDIQRADLIISHAGAGSCLEVLSARKPLLVVINEELMNNHQLELAQQLHEDRHVHYTTCTNLEHTLQHMDLQTLEPLPTVDSHKFTNFLDSIFGFQSQECHTSITSFMPTQM